MSAVIPILLYHSVRPVPAEGFERFTIDPGLFAEHLDTVTGLGFTACTVGALAAMLRAGTPPPRRTVVITFDDGYADFAEYAWPRLRARGLTATMYAVAGHLGGRSAWMDGQAGAMRMLPAADLRALSGEGLEIGAHSVSHPQLDCLPLACAREEIRDSRAILEDALSCEVTTFAYPHGFHDRNVRRAAIDAGYTSAAAVRNALSHTGDDVYRLARITMAPDDGPGRIAALLRGRGARIAAPHERMQTTVWRGTRRIRSRLRAVHA
ncbi:polysaccharide deacetylase family protein [Tomitella gaofuii]|uniref:polysaccharide deacetylase family protein n=1 Tax=Tomitella gaofuii TaxID=2760083 RepID=UPI0015FC9A9D|nr:polysaccharide deacetylase family protein [Tomitella gaofuii]